MPPEQNLVLAVGHLTVHARRDGARVLLLGAVALLEPTRPEALAQIAPPEYHWTRRVGPQVVLQLVLETIALDAGEAARAVRQPQVAEAHLAQVVGQLIRVLGHQAAMPVFPEREVRVDQRAVLEADRSVDGHEVGVEVAPQHRAQRRVAHVLRAGVVARVGRLLDPGNVEVAARRPQPLLTRRQLAAFVDAVAGGPVSVLALCSDDGDDQGCQNPRAHLQQNDECVKNLGTKFFMFV